MAPLDDMSAPGTATYSSDTMVVGDGTWDFTINNLLLPNLQGLNLATTQYNGTWRQQCVESPLVAFDL